MEIYCVVTVIKTIQFCWSHRCIAQWNRIENLEIDPYKYAQLTFFYKGAKLIQWKEDSLYNKCAEAIEYPQANKKNLNLNLLPYIKMNSKQTIPQKH